MASVSVSVSDEMKKRLEQYNIVNWSAVARKAFEAEISKRELLESITKDSKLTEKDVEEMGAKIKAGIARAHERKKKAK